MFPPADKLNICFAHVAYRLRERFSALDTGIASFEVRQIFPSISFAFATTGAFQIHDAPDPRIHLRNIQRAARLDQHGKTGVA